MLSNNVIKIITSLGSKKYRQKYNMFVVEGVKNIGEVIKSSIKIKELFITEDFWPDETHIKKTFIEEKDLKKIANILGITYEQSFTLPNGDKIELTN